MAGCRDSNGNLKPESPCAQAAKRRAAARAAAMANKAPASNGQYAKAVAKGKTTK